MLLANVDATVQFITVFLIFILVCALTYFTTRFVGGYQKNKMKDSNIQVIETTKVTNNKYLQIVNVGERFFLISICRDSIQVIGELNKDDVKIPEPQEETIHFKDILEKARNKKSKK